MAVEINWEPQDRQLTFLSFCGLDFPFTENAPRQALSEVLGYGGAAGGGKTDTLLLIAIIAALKYPKLNVGYFRREFPQLEGLGGAILRSQELITQIAKYNEQKHRWTFPNKSRLQFNHCKEEKDVYNYQSQQFDILILDEATQFTEFQADYLITRNRATVDYPTFKPFVAMGTNPGNVGHAWFKERFYDLGPEIVKEYEYPTGIKKTHVFIPSKLEDNQILEERDPNYRKNLSTNKYNQEVLLGGSWEVFAGQVFRFRAIQNGKPYHVIPPQPIPKNVTRFIDIDWGGDKPVAISWKAVLNCLTEDGHTFQRMWLYRELYYGIQSQGIPAAEEFREREGLDFTDKNVAKIIAQYSKGENIEYVVGDPAMKGKKPSSVTAVGESIMEAMNDQWDDDEESLFIKPGDNNRQTGLERVRYWLSEAPDGMPYYQIFSSCKDTIRTYPLLLYKEGTNDVDTDMEDHAYDRDRYGFMSRPYGAPEEKQRKPDETDGTFSYHFKRQRMKRIQSRL